MFYFSDFGKAFLDRVMDVGGMWDIFCWGNLIYNIPEDLADEFEELFKPRAGKRDSSKWRRGCRANFTSSSHRAGEFERGRELTFVLGFLWVLFDQSRPKKEIVIIEKREPRACLIAFQVHLAIRQGCAKLTERDKSVVRSSCS